MAYDAGLVERLRDAVLRAGERGSRERGVFGGRGFLLGKNTFLIAYRESLLVKTAPDEYSTLLAMQGITPFAPGGERPMGTWLVVPEDAIADDPELLEWVERGLRGVRAVPPPKPKSARSAPTKGARTPAAKSRAKAKRPSARKKLVAKRARGTKKRP